MKTALIEGITQAGLESYLATRQYDALYWPTFFPLKTVNTLDGKTLIGAQGSRVAGHVIAYDAKAPEAGRKAIDFRYFDIPKIAQSRRKSEQQIIEHQITKNLRGLDAVIEDYFNDVDFVIDSCEARKEWYVLQALSATKLQLTTTNNPQGIVNETTIDFGVPTANKKVVSVVWSTGNAATMDPITDFKAVVKAARAKGIKFSRILMNATSWDLVTGATKFLAYFLNPALSVTNPVTLEAANRLLEGYGIPPIVVIDTSVGIEAKSGTITATDPWSDHHVTFIPEVQCGNMFSGPIAEQIEKPDGVLMAMRGGNSVTIRREYNPVSVLTKAECNVFPSWPSVDRTYSLYTNSASTWA